MKANKLMNKLLQLTELILLIFKYMFSKIFVSPFCIKQTQRFVISNENLVKSFENIHAILIMESSMVFHALFMAWFS